MLIYKEELPLDTSMPKALKLPFKTVEEAKNHILKLDLQYGMPVMWYQVDNDEDGKIGECNNDYLIMAIGTGHDYTDSAFRRVFNRANYIGTVLTLGGNLVLHYFLNFKKDIDDIVDELEEIA